MRAAPFKHRSVTSDSGFTLVELLVAISMLAVLMALAWRGIDTMTTTQKLTAQRSDQSQVLQAGLSQWKYDLDAVVQTPGTSALEWDGSVLRITRRMATGDGGLLVVGWTRRGIGQTGQWLRWQSQTVRTQGQWRDAWSRAKLWAQIASTKERTHEVPVVALEGWQIFYFRGNAWTNPMSSQGLDSPVNGDANSGGAGSMQAPSEVAMSAPQGAEPAAQAESAPSELPDGVRLILNLPADSPGGGKLTVDWVRPQPGAAGL